MDDPLLRSFCAYLYIQFRAIHVGPASIRIQGHTKAAGEKVIFLADNKIASVLPQAVTFLPTLRPINGRSARRLS